MSRLGPEARAILEAGRAGDEPSAADRRRVRAQVMRAIAAGGAGALASSAAAQASAAGLKASAISVWKIVVGLTVVTAVAGGVATRIASHAPPRASAAVATTTVALAPPPQAPSAEPAAPTPTTEPTTPAPQPVAIPAPPPAHALAPRPRASAAPVASAPPAAPSAPPPPDDTLASEAEGLGAAQRAMRRGDPASALAEVDKQQGSVLREEREAVRVLALCQLGRVAEARAAAARFLQAYPRAPLADRVRRACDEAR